MSSYPPGPVPSRQELLKFARDPLAYFSELATYGEFAYVRLATRDTYLVTSPDLLRDILVERAEQFQKPEHTRDSTQTFLGEGMLNASGPLHRRHRRIIQPVFNRVWVEGYAGAMETATRRLISRWEDGQTLDFAQAMMALTLNIVGETIFGVPDLADSADLTRATAVMQQYSGNTLTRSKLVAVTEADCREAVRVLDELVASVLAKHQAQGARDLITLMKTATDPETGERMSDQEIRDEALTLLMAGHESTANGLAWTFYLLATHPEAETRLRAEIEVQVGGRAVVVDDLPHLPYLERVLKESLRLYPPAWLMGRTPFEPLEVGGYPIQPDANLVICPYVSHRNPRYFPEPEVFNPDRFLTEPVKYTYLPFGTGPRICIGQPFALLELAVVTVTLLQHFRLKTAPDYVAQPDPMMTLRPKGGLPLSVESLSPVNA